MLDFATGLAQSRTRPDRCLQNQEHRTRDFVISRPPHLRQQAGGMADCEGVDMQKRGIHRHAGRAIGYDPRVPLGKPDRLSRRSALDAVSEAGDVVYAMRLPDGTIKIGHSGNLGQRRNALGGEMLAFRFGTLADEQAIHDRLADHRHHAREWYYPTPGVLAVVNEMREALHLEPV